jgi:hypothetical protein
MRWKASRPVDWGERSSSGHQEDPFGNREFTKSGGVGRRFSFQQEHL